MIAVSLIEEAMYRGAKNLVDHVADTATAWVECYLERSNARGASKLRSLLTLEIYSVKMKLVDSY